MVVLEGKACAGVQEGVVDGVQVIHARGAGDDALAAVTEGASEPVLLVSADRGLRTRVERLGARVVGPSWLWDRLDP
jgi:rRNA-processing protein FCF1